MADDIRIVTFLFLVICSHIDVLRGDVRLAIDVRRIDEIITAYMHEHRIPGASIAISKDGNTILNKAYGRAGKNSLVTPWSVFRIGSISKAVTAIAVLKLYENRLLDLDERVFGSKGILKTITLPLGGDRRLLSITVRHLLQHSGGWDHKSTVDPFSRSGLARIIGLTQPVTQRDVITYVLGQQLAFNPGSRFSYSNFGYVVLGRVIEQLTNESYATYVTDLLRSLGIYRMRVERVTQYEYNPAEVTYYADLPPGESRSASEDDRLAVDRRRFELTDSSDGWTASAIDLVRLVDSLTGGRLLSSATVGEMLARPAGARRTAWYGLGFVVQDGGATWWHSGELAGSTGVLTHARDGYAWAVLLNRRVRNNDVNDVVEYALRRGACATPPAGDAAAAVNCSDGGGGGGGEADVISADGENLVKIAIPERKIRFNVELLSAKNYRPTWIDASTRRGVVLFNTVWTKNGDGLRWYVFTGLTAARFRRKAKSKRARGYRALHVDSYVSERRLRYAAIFVRDAGPASRSYVGHNLRRHKRKFHRYMQRGFRLAVQSLTLHRGRLHIAAVYDRTAVGQFTVMLGLTLGAYLREVAAQVRRGRALAYVDAYDYGGSVRFSVIWDSRTKPVWAADRGLSRYALLNRLHRYAHANVPVRCITSYDGAYRLNYAVLWH